MTNPSHEVVYLSDTLGFDQAIVRGLQDAGFMIFYTNKINDTLAAFKNGHMQAPMLVSDVQAGALALLSLMREHGITPPPTVLFDRTGDNIHAPIQALQFGVREYLLASDPETQRETRVRVLAERVQNMLEKQMPVNGAGPATSQGFEWDSVSHTIQIGERYILLSPIEGRIFNLLLQFRGKTVRVEDMIARALLKPGMQVDEGVKLLRPHMVRLRNKFDNQSELAHRIVNMRGEGYMLV